MISIEFPLSDKRFKKVRSAWKAYRTNLGETVPDEQSQPVFFSKREDMFTDLLYEMGTALGYEFDKTEISKEVYSTVFHGKVEADLNLIREKIVEVLTGKAALPMAVVHFPNDPELGANQAEYLKAMLAFLKDGKAWPIMIVGGDEGKVVRMRPSDPPSDTKAG